MDFVLEGERIRKFSDSWEDEIDAKKYFKIGRTTGLTFGKLNGIKSETNLELPLNGEDQGQQKRKMISQAQVLLTPEELSTPFTRAGDSGAWVCDMFGTLVGLVWGGGEKTSYCTPIGQIFADIEAQTGMKVELP